VTCKKREWLSKKQRSSQGAKYKPDPERGSTQ